MESKLEQAIRHVMTGRQIVAAQRQRVAALTANGGDPYGAEALLRQFEKTLAIFEEDLDALRAKHDSH